MATPNMPERMRAAQVVEFNKPYAINTIPLPSLSPHDLLIRVAVASLCHTDSMVSSGMMGTPLPCTASHEGSGTVVAVGAAVSPDSFSPGDRVMAGILYQSCDTCADCLGPANYRQYCQFSKGYCGVTTHGFFAEYARVDARWAARVPDNLALEIVAPLACAGCTIYRGIVLAGLGAGEWLAIVGSGGGLGHIGIQFARAKGLNVIGIDARDEGLELSRKVGATVVLDARKGMEDVVKAVHGVTGGAGVACTLNVSDAAGAAALSCAVTKMHGDMIQIAQPDSVSIPFRELVFRDIRVKGSLICSAEEAREMLDVVAEHGISVETNVFHGLDELETLLSLAHGGKMRGKGLIVMDQEQIEKGKEMAAVE